MQEINIMSNLNLELDENEECQTTQDLPGRLISSTKLVQMLKITFGANAYDVYMAHNAFCIKAPRMLTTDEIAQCKR